MNEQFKKRVNMNENIKPVYKNGVAVAFDTVSTAEVKIPSMRFDRYEDAELAVSIAKAIQARGNTDFDPILSGVKYTFRILGLNDSPWVE